MAKPLLIIAVVANLFYTVSTGQAYSYAKSEASSSSSSSSVVATSTSVSGDSSDCDYPQPPKCRKNEIWSYCPIAVCAPKTCYDVGFPVPCPDLHPHGDCPVPPGCICKEEYVRNKVGHCIPMKRCPSCGGDPNAESGPGTNCNRLCSNYNKKPGACIQGFLYNACECKRGYVYDEIRRKCVYPEDCACMTCGPNEIYDPCPSPCPLRLCGFNDATALCPRPLIPGDPNCRPPTCRCKDGYYRNDAGKCVLWEQCPVCKGINEMYDPCLQTCPAQRCDVNPALVQCMRGPSPGDPNCQPGCRCIDDHVRNHWGVCIPRDKCPICRKNEIFDPCIAPCPPHKCDVDERLIRCAAPPQLGDPSCKAGCRCADGYFGNSDGDCVTWEECSKCGPYEFYDCGGECDNECATLHTQNRTNCPYVNIRCTDRCYCKDGYARDENNICIPIKECNAKCKGPYEFYDCGGECDNECATLHKQNRTNCPFVNKRCTNKCYCKDGYARDENKICIPIEKCKVPKCDKHEVFSNCTQQDCRPQSCSQLGFTVHCPKINPKHCKKGCICEQDYVRDCDGVCIPKDKCPSCGGDKNAVSGCGINCNRHCKDIGQEPVYCILVCPENKCDCKPGYYYDDNTNECVLPKHCTPTCRDNEVYSDCIQGECRPKNCTQLGHHISCPRIDPKYCQKGCLCKKGYLRNHKGVCVSAKQCPKCRKNEIFDPCIAPCPPHKCDVDERLIRCAAPPQLGDPSCKAGCRCADGYFKNSDGDCVTWEECSKCGPYEFYDCGGECDNECATLHTQNRTNCPYVNIRCTDRCYCKDGYARDENNICIPIKECNAKCKGPHEFYDCGGECDNECATLHKQNRTNCPYVNIRCTNRCYCKDGYARDENKICIPIDKCKVPKCDKHEVFSNCTQQDCRPQSCSQLGFTVHCPKKNPKHCKKGCICEQDYVRDCEGVCIPKDKCPSCGGDRNAVSGCGINCNRHCKDIGQKPVFCILVCPENKCDCKPGHYYDDNTNNCVLPKHCTPTCRDNEVYSDCIQGECRPKNCTQLGHHIPCPRIDPKYCKKGCLCKKGYLKNNKGVCVPEKQCPPVCKDNEVYSECINGGCSAKNCSQIGQDIPCIKIDPKYCIKGCLCKEGYLREKNGVCVPKEKCKPVCKDNEVYSECINGGCSAKNCSQIGQDIPCIKIDPKYCIKGCLCKEDYLREKNGVCVPKEKCKPVCKDNEVYSECINGGCSAKNCSQIGQDIPCIKIDPKYCIKGCLCKEGYLREANGVCVPEEKCKHKCTKPNEEYVKCGYNCPPNTCESLDKAYVCPIKDAINCKPQCKCKSGHYRNKLGECISEEDCRKCMGLHEYFSCGGACDNECFNIKKQNQTSCPIVNIQCNKKCYCEKNYARAKNGTCIPIARCNDGHQCGKNEVYDECPSCLPRKCCELGNPLPCANSTHKCQKPRCVCKSDYVWNDDGVCIPKKSCPSCGGDPNAVSGCGNCIKRCEHLIKKPDACILICKENACDCKEGYYYDKQQKKCVLPCDCTGICGKNEVYENCDNPSCRPKKCSEVGYELNCTDPIPCKKGCVCKNDYVKNHKGVCIPIKHCPSCRGDQNAVSGCGVNCLKKCYDLQFPDKPKICPKICKINDCDCRDDYYLDEITKKCVKPEHCTPTCDDNEVYDNCVNGGCGHRNCSQLGGPILCIDPLKCKGGCTCKNGHLRLEDTGKCIPEDTCPNICNKPHEEYVKCPESCPPQTCESVKPGVKYHCPLKTTDKSKCVGQCRCKKGYYKNLNNECISKEDCLKCTGHYEYFSCGPACDNVCCDLDTQSKDNCPIKNIKCVPQCYCKDGYARDSEKKCVPISDCPGRVNITTALENFERGNIALTFNFLKQMAEKRFGQNFMFSALSVIIAFAQLTLNASGKNLEQLLRLQNLSKEEIRAVYPVFLNNIKAQQEVVFTVANKIYGNKLNKFKKDYMKEGSKVFGSSAENIDFNKNVEAAATINEWAANNTNGLIKDLVKPDMFNGDTRMVILNALYFLGKWIHQFKEENTKPRDFYLDNNETITLLTMNQENTFPYAESDQLGCQIIKLPYKGNFSLVIYLSWEKTELKNLVSKLAEPNAFIDSLELLKNQKVNVSIPKMDFKTVFDDLGTYLMKYNITNIFSPSNDFKDIFVEDEPLWVSDAIQKSYFIVDEKGTEAAAVTGVIARTLAIQSPPKVYKFDLNHPAPFVLLMGKNPVFCGVFSGAK